MPPYITSPVGHTRKKKVAKKQVTQTDRLGGTAPFGMLATRKVSKSMGGLDVRAILNKCRSEVEVLRILNRHSAVFSTAVFNLVEIALEDLRIRCYHPDGSHDAASSAIGKRLLRELDAPKDILKGYNDKRSAVGMTATMLQEVVLSGGVFTEAVVEDGVVSKLVSVPLESIDFKSEKGSIVPHQFGKDLNYPNMFYASLHQQATTTKASSMMAPAVGTTIGFSDFISSMESSLDRTGHSRLTVYLNKEMYLQQAPEECNDDTTKLAEWLESNRANIVQILSEIEPQDALVMFDDQKAELLTAEGSKSDYTELLNTIAGILALSLKSHPSILGLRLGGSQSLSNIEALTYLHIAKGVQRPVEEIWSRIITMQLRLLGIPSTAEVTFSPINLRPETELETHYLTKQTRHLQLLSLGIISDEDFFYRMDLSSPPVGYVNLSGTHFMQVTGDVKSTGGASNAQDGGAEQTLNPDSKRNKVN